MKKTIMPWCVFCLTLASTQLFAGYSNLEGDRLNFRASLSMPRDVVETSWTYAPISQMDSLDFPSYGKELESMVPASKLSTAKVVAYKMAVRLPLSVNMVTRALVTNKDFLTRVNGVEFIPGVDQVTVYGMLYQGYVSLPLNRTLLELDIRLIDLKQDTQKPRFQEWVDFLGQGDENLGVPEKIVASKARELKGGYLHGLYNVFKIYPISKTEVMLTMYTFSVVDGSSWLIRAVGGNYLKEQLNEMSMEFVEEIAKTH